MTESGFLNIIDAIARINYVVVLKVLGIVLVLFWLFVILWVINDARSRSSRLSFVILSVMLVLFFNLLGLIVYFIIRPQITIDESRWMELEHKYLQFETAGLSSCPKCDYDLQPDFNVCPKCGFEIKVECDNCKTYIYKEWEFCPYCGQKNAKWTPRVQDSLNKKEKFINKQSVIVRKIVENIKSKIAKFKKNVQEKKAKQIKQKNLKKASNNKKNSINKKVKKQSKKVKRKNK